MGVKTLYEYFYKLAYGDKGADKATLVNDCLDVADARIESNKNRFVNCSDYDHPDDAITAISTDNKTLLVTEAETCDTNFTVPANVSVKFERGGSFAIANGITVTFNGQIDAGLWEIFTCTGTGIVILNSGSTPEAYPEWWGAKGDGTTDDAAIFNSVLTQLDAGEVKTMKLNNHEYVIRDTIILYNGISIIGKNNYPYTLLQVANIPDPQTRIIFAPTSEKDLFDATQTGELSSLVGIYIGGMYLYGNTTGGVTYSKYALNLDTSKCVFENLGIERFQDGIYCNGTMTNKFRDIYIGKCSHAGIYTSTSGNTSNIFDNVMIRSSPWGAILRQASHFRFINCLFESLTTGGVNIYKECGQLEFSMCYGENTPSTDAGDNYGMFYINHDGTTLTEGNIIINGGRWTGYTGCQSTFCNIDETSTRVNVSIMNVFLWGYLNGIEASANTANYSIYLTGMTQYGITNVFVGTTGKLRGFFGTTSAELAGVISDETGTGALVFGTSPTLVTPVIGVAAATSINFGDNALAAYKTGEWTIGISFGGGTTGITYAAGYTTGYYTKVGNLCTITGLCILTSKGTSTGDAFITGLPFTVANNNAGFSSVALSFCYVTFVNQFQGTAVKNTTTITLREITEAGVRTTLTDANFADDSYITVSCTYRIN